MILHAEIDDQPRPDRQRGDQEHHRPPARRVGDFHAEPLERAGEPHGDQQRVGYDAKQGPRDLAPRRFADETAIDVKSMGNREVEPGPEREHDQHDDERGGQGDEDRAVHGFQARFR